MELLRSTWPNCKSKEFKVFSSRKISSARNEGKSLHAQMQNEEEGKIPSETESCWTPYLDNSGGNEKTVSAILSVLENLQDNCFDSSLPPVGGDTAGLSVEAKPILIQMKGDLQQGCKNKPLLSASVLPVICFVKDLFLCTGM